MYPEASVMIGEYGSRLSALEGFWAMNNRPTCGYGVSAPNRGIPLKQSGRLAPTSRSPELLHAPFHRSANRPRTLAA